MAHLINDECIACGACAAECPVECIAESDPIYVINPKRCTDCSDCIEVCPVDAISDKFGKRQDG